MPLNPFVHNAAYFRDTKARKETMKAADFDYQFNQFTGYLNTKVVPVLDNLISGALPGTVAPGTANKFLTNIGDGTTDWLDIAGATTTPGSLSWRALKAANPSTILAAGANQIFTSVTPSAAGQILVSANNNVPVWQFLKGENVTDRSITGDKIALASINAVHLYPGTGLAIRLADGSINDRRFVVQGAITAPKIADGAFTSDKFGANQDRISFITARDNTSFGREGILSSRLPDGYLNLENDNLDFYAFNEQGSTGVLNLNVPIPGIKMSAPVDITKFARNSIKGTAVKHASLNGNRLKYVLPNSSRAPNNTTFIANGAILPRHLTLQLRQKLGL